MTETLSIKVVGRDFQLLRPQRQFAKIMFIEFAVRFGGFVQWERAGDMDLKRARLDQTIEFLDLPGFRLEVIALDFHTGSRFWRGDHAVRMGPAPAVAHGLQPAIPPFPTGGGWGRG